MSKRHRRTYRVAKDGTVEELSPQDIMGSVELRNVLAPNDEEEEEETTVQGLSPEDALYLLRLEDNNKVMKAFFTAVEYPRNIDPPLVPTDNRPVIVAQRERDPLYVPGYA